MDGSETPKEVWSEIQDGWPKRSSDEEWRSGDEETERNDILMECIAIAVFIFALSCQVGERVRRGRRRRSGVKR